MELEDTELGARPRLGGVVLSVFSPEPVLRPPATNATLPKAELESLLRNAAHLRATLPVPSWLSFEGRLQDLELLLAGGVKIFGLVHTWDNPLAGAATDPRPVTTGLTPAGRFAVRQVYAAGGLVDVSHMSDAAFADTAGIARELGKPLLATHSGARAVHASPRNLTDEQLRQVAASGGLVGITLHGPHLAARGAEPATASDWVAHVEHLVELVGVGHVALGSDFDAMAQLPQGIRGANDLGTLAEALSQAGFSKTAATRILSANALDFLGCLEPGRATSGSRHCGAVPP